jgi:hypothetical protein
MEEEVVYEIVGSVICLLVVWIAVVLGSRRMKAD